MSSRSPAPSNTPSAISYVIAAVIAAVPVGMAAFVLTQVALFSVVPDGMAWAVVGAAVVAGFAVVGVGRGTFPTTALAVVWLPLLTALGVAYVSGGDGVTLTTTGVAAIDQPAMFVAVCVEALVVVGFGGLATLFIGVWVAAIAGKRTPGAGIVAEAALAVSAFVGASAYGWALQLEAINVNGAYLAGARTGQRLADLAFLMGLTFILPALIALGKGLSDAAKRQSVVTSAVVAGLGVVIVGAAASLATSMGAQASVFVGIEFTDVTPLQTLSGRRGGSPQSVCRNSGVVGVGSPDADSPMLIEADAVGAGVAACFAAYAEAGSTVVDVMARRGPFDDVVTAPALAPFVAATHYVSSTVPLCDGKNGTAITADSDVVALFSGEVCFTAAAAPPTPPAPATP